MDENSFRVKRQIILTQFADGSWDGIGQVLDREVPWAERSRAPISGMDPGNVLRACLNDMDATHE